MTPRLAGAYRRIVDLRAVSDPVIAGAAKPQVVDHCFFRARNGTWQAWVQIRDTAVGRIFTRWEKSGGFADGLWSYKGICWRADKAAGESVGTPEAKDVIQAPFVLTEPERRLLVYGGGPVDGGDVDRQVCLAVSRDGIGFTRHADAQGRSRIAVGPRHSADAMLVRHGDAYLLYVGCSYLDVGAAKAAVTLRESSDLIRWSPPRVVHAGGTPGVHTHSSQSAFVLRRDGVFYLFVMGWSNEMKTAVYRSADFRDFGEGDDHLLTVLPASAAEIVESDGEWFLSSLIVPTYDGVQVAPLIWGR